jgi:hypothetical protein
MIRRLACILSVCTIASAVAVAQPKKPDPKAPAPAKDAPKPDAGSGSATPAPPPEEPPPKDIEGRDENPGNPGGVVVDEPKVAAPVKKKETKGYPTQEVVRPINLPANMSEVSLGPHAQLGFDDATQYAGGDALRARYGVTREVQIGLTYLFAGIYDDPATAMDDKLGFHGGKAVGLDVTILLKNWVGVRVGVPVYLKPTAFSLAIGVPMKFTFGDKYAIGGFDDLLNIKLSNFAPRFDQELFNAANAELERTNAKRSAGQLRISTFGVYQKDSKTALIGRIGFNMEDFAANSTQSDAAGGGITYFLRAGVNYTPRRYLDLGVSVGFDDLAHVGSFGPAALLAFRI